MTWRDIEAVDLRTLRNPVVIDVRSPCEFAAERIPHAINIPLLNDIERAEVGTVYAKQGEVVARRLGLKFISPKIPEIVDQICALKQRDSQLVVHCWRGGLRSESVASFLSIVGVDCWRLRGGYKAWRRVVLDDFARDAWSFVPVVVHGRTGVGKTEILRELENLGANVLDLESLANHRGSLFGGLGFSIQPGQKNFEGELWLRLQGTGTAPLFVEAESRKIGRITLPDFIMNRVNNGRKVLVAGSLKSRVSRLLSEYMPEQNESVVASASAILPMLVESLGKKTVSELSEHARLQEFDTLVEKLLLLHYDPLYDRHILQHQPFDLEVDCEDAAVAAIQIFNWSKNLQAVELDLL